MKYTIQNIDTSIGKGYAFLDETGGCIIIVYSEHLKQLVIKWLEG